MEEYTCSVHGTPFENFDFGHRPKRIIQCPICRMEEIEHLKLNSSFLQKERSIECQTSPQ